MTEKITTHDHQPKKNSSESEPIAVEPVSPEEVAERYTQLKRDHLKTQQARQPEIQVARDEVEAALQESGKLIFYTDEHGKLQAKREHAASEEPAVAHEAVLEQSLQEEVPQVQEARRAVEEAIVAANGEGAEESEPDPGPPLEKELKELSEKVALLGDNTTRLERRQGQHIEEAEYVLKRLAGELENIPYSVARLSDEDARAVRRKVEQAADSLTAARSMEERKFDQGFQEVSQNAKDISENPETSDSVRQIVYELAMTLKKEQSQSEEKKHQLRIVTHKASDIVYNMRSMRPGDLAQELRAIASQLQRTQGQQTPIGAKLRRLNEGLL